MDRNIFTYEAPPFNVSESVCNAASVHVKCNVKLTFPRILVSLPLRGGGVRGCPPRIFFIFSVAVLLTTKLGGGA